MSDETAEEQSEETADSDDSSDSDEDEHTDSSALRRIQDSIVSRWDTFSHSANNATKKLNFFKQIKKGRKNKQDERRFQDFLDDEENEATSSALGEIYFDNLAKKLSCILEADEEEEKKGKKLHFMRRVNKFGSKVKAKFQRRDDLGGPSREEELGENYSDDFDVFVRQELARRQLYYKTREESLALAAKWSSEEDLPKQKQVMSRDSDKVNFKKRGYKKKLLKSANIGKLDVIEEVSDYRAEILTKDKHVGFKFPLKSFDTSQFDYLQDNSRKQKPKERIETGKSSGKLDVKKQQQRAVKVELDGEINLQLPAQKSRIRSKIVGKEVRSTKIGEKKEDRSVQNDSEFKKVEIIKPHSNTGNTESKQKKEYDTSVVIDKTSDCLNIIDAAIHDAVQNVVAPTERSERIQEMVDIQRKTPYKRKQPTKVDAESSEMNEPQWTSLERIDASPRCSSAANERRDFTTERLNLNATNTGPQSTFPQVTEESLPDGDGMSPVSPCQSSEQANLPLRFDKFLTLFEFFRISKIWGNRSSSSNKFAHNSAVPPMSIFRGNRSLSDAIYKVKLRASKQMRTKNRRGIPLQETGLSIWELSAIIDEKDPTEDLFVNSAQRNNNNNWDSIRIEDQEDEGLDCFVSSGVRKANKERRDDDNKDEDDDDDDSNECWQRIDGNQFDFDGNDDCCGETETETRLSDSTFSGGTSFFDLLYKIKWFPGTHSRKKPDDIDQPVYEHDFYSPRDYLDKFGVPIPVRGSNIKIEEDFIFETAWQKTMNQAEAEESGEYSMTRLTDKSMSNAVPEKRSRVQVQALEVVSDDDNAPVYKSEQSATSVLRRSSKATRGYTVSAEESTLRGSVEADPSNFNLRRPKTFVVAKQTDRAEDDEEEDSDEESDSDSDENSSSEEDEDDDEDEQQYQDENDRNHSSRGKKSHTSKLVDRIVSMFSLNNEDGAPESALDLNMLDNLPDEQFDPEAVVITEMSSEDSRLDEAFNICVDLKARRKEALTKLLVTATGNKYMTEYFRMEIEKRTENNQETSNKVNPCCIKGESPTRPSKVKPAAETQMKTSSRTKAQVASSSGLVADVDPRETRDSAENKKNLAKKPQPQKKMSRDNS